MSFRGRGPDYLGIALTARLAIDTLVGFYDGEKVWHASEKGIEVINEARAALQRLHKCEHNDSFLFFSRSCRHFDSYDLMKFLEEMVDNLGWTTWESDLEQWLTNKEVVLDFFMHVESYALGRHRHSDGGCF